MNPSLIDPLQQMVRDYRLGAHLVLFFDYDGTLAPFADEPSRAVLPRQTRIALEWLVRLPRVHVGIISGRELSDLTAMVAIDGLFLGGTNGLELDFRGLSVRHPRAAAALSELLRLGNSFTETIARFPGAWLEKKRLGLTLHYRHVARRRHAELRALISLYIESCTLPFVVHEGAAAFEIVPRLGWHKGTAVGMFHKSIPAAGTVILYAGDNSNDHDAMAAVLREGGITIGIGHNAPRNARLTLPRPEHLSDFLSELAVVIAAMGTAPDRCRFDGDAHFFRQFPFGN